MGVGSGVSIAEQAHCGKWGRGREGVRESLSLLGAEWNYVAMHYPQSWRVERGVRNHLSKPPGFRAERYSMVVGRSRRVASPSEF